MSPHRSSVNFNLNINVIVNVHAKTMPPSPMPATLGTSESPPPTAMTTKPKSPPKSLAHKTHTSNFTQRLGIAYSGGGGGGGCLQLLLIINLIFMLFSTLCCQNVAIQTTKTLTDNAVENRTVVDRLFGNIPITEEGGNEFVANVTRDCRRRCSDEENTFHDEFGIECSAGGENCYKSRCSKGCELWWWGGRGGGGGDSKEFESCPEACSTTQFNPLDLPCISACEMAQRHYWHLQRLAIVEPAAIVAVPRPRNDTLTSHSLTLEWPLSLPDNYMTTPNTLAIQYQSLGSTSFAVAADGVQDINDGAGDDDWYNVADFSCNENFICDINDGLMPYTSYRFRFVIHIGDGAVDAVNSPPSAVVRTLPAGPPISRPIIRHVYALHEGHVAMFWRPGKFTNGPVTGYRLKLKNTSSGAGGDLQELLLPPSSDRHVFTDLIPFTNYSISLAVLNAEGESPFSVSNVTTVGTPMLNPPANLMYDLKSILIAGEYSLKLKSLDAMTDTFTLYSSEHIISDYDVLLSEQRVFVVNANGQIYSFQWTNSSETQLLPLNVSTMEFKPSKLAVDWLHRRLFIAGELISNKTWSIMTFDFNGNSLEILIDNLQEPLRQLSADPLNGWIFWTNANDGRLQRLNLASLNVEEVLRANSSVGPFVCDYQRYQLVAYNKSDGNYYDVGYDGSYVQRRKAQTFSPLALPQPRPFYLNSNFLASPSSSPISTTTSSSSSSSGNGRQTSSPLPPPPPPPPPPHLSPFLHGDVQSFVLDGNVLIATNGSHLIYQNYRMNENELHVITRDIEWCWSVMPLQWRFALQPSASPPQLTAPHDLQALMTSNMAKISWRAPDRLHGYQSDSAWQRWEYELEIWDVASSSAFNIRNIKTTYFNVEKLQANNLYKFRVRVMASTGSGAMANGGNGGGLSVGMPRAMGDLNAGPWSEEVFTRSWPLGEHKFLWATGEGLYETNEIGMHVRRLFGMGGGAIDDFVQLNGTVWWYTSSTTGTGRLHCANIMNPEVNCSFASTANDDGDGHDDDGNGKLTGHRRIASLAYDWRGGKVYWTDHDRNCVLRANIDGSERELLPVFGAQLIEIDAYSGHIYYSTGRRLARRTLSGSFPIDEVEYFHMNELAGGGMIRGIALDVQHQRQIYWISRQSDGRVRLYRRALDKQPSRQATAFETKWRDQLLPHDIAWNSLQYLSEIESLMWVESPSDCVVLMRTNASSSKDRICSDGAHQLVDVKKVRLRTDFTPYMDYSVIPDAVEEESIRIDDGFWNDFNIKWSPIETANNFTVFYKVLLSFRDAKRTLRSYGMEVSEPVIRITEFHQPRLQVNVTITPHTHWRSGVAVHKQLSTPGAAPIKPKRLRVFVQREDRPLQSAPNISAVVRWDPPENVSVSDEVVFKVTCWQNERLFAAVTRNYSEPRALEATVGNLEAGESYSFQVEAFAAGRLNGDGGGGGGEKSSYHSVHVNPAVQSVPRVIYTTAEFIAELDFDSQRRSVLLHTSSSEVEHLTMIRGEQRLLWVNENVELISFVPGGSGPVKLARMRAEVLSLTVDWVSRIVYWAERDTDAEKSVAIYKLDLCQFEGRVLLGQRMWTTARGKTLKDLLVLPFSNALLWLEYDAIGGGGDGQANASLVGRNLSDASALRFKQSAASASDGWLHMFEGDASAEMETVNLIDQRGKIFIYDVHRQMTSALKGPFNYVEDGVKAVARDAGYIYAVRNDSLQAYNRRKLNLIYAVNISEVGKIKAFNVQEYPDTKCLLPDEQKTAGHERLRMTVKEIDENFVTVQLPRLNTADECWVAVPGVKYTIALSPSDNVDGNGDGDGDGERRQFTSHSEQVNITNLSPFTNYTVSLKAVTFYQQKLGLPAMMSENLTIRTAAGTPTQPRNFTAFAVSPSEIHIEWQPPEVMNCDRVRYQLHWQVENSTLRAYQALDGDTTVSSLTNLEPSRVYTVWLEVYATKTKFNVTHRLAVLTYEKPNPLQLIERTAYNLTFSWYPTDGVTGVILVCHALSGDSGDFSLDISQNTTHILVPDLEPRTKYEFHLELTYDDLDTIYYWPELLNDRFVYETLGDRPSIPGQPQIELITGEIFKVFWEPARNNGAPIVEYSLEALQVHMGSALKRIRRNGDDDGPSADDNGKATPLFSQLLWAEEPTPLEDKWIVYCNTTELSCIIREMHKLRLVMFRVRARNEHGWGPYSEESERIAEPYLSPQKRDSLVFAIIAPAVIVSSCVIALVILKTVKNRRMKAKKLLEKSRPSIWSTVSSVHQQQQLMGIRNRAFSTTSNSTLYMGGPLSDADIALLPQINWDQITLLNFLGSGAFGEVYEGVVNYNNGTDTEKVAIKSLRKGASEFSELLQEALLMSNFKHENIVRLIGVCFDSESISIVMEHMEGGDLLSYLRNSRSSQSEGSLTVHDLVSMCIDVATGCCYLEDMHYVHRDLACRNCLVSSRDPSKRVVKIGDFGLARDIYKNDYYRKEGEGLLPVRWMSPESLIDGVFTTQSDVWAFGVLCWEILSLGQQPYVARTNFEVVNFVKDGGRLDKPENCPDKFFELMLECWASDPDDRPTFRKCLNTLIATKTDLRRLNSSSTKGNNDDTGPGVYVNSRSITLGSFLGNALAKVDEASDEEEEKAVSMENINLRVHYDHRGSDGRRGKSASLSHLATGEKTLKDVQEVEFEEESDQEAKVYLNEGVSRL